MNILASIVLFALFAARADDARAAGARPNILFLMADDWSSPHAGTLGDPEGCFNSSAAASGSLPCDLVTERGQAD